MREYRARFLSTVELPLSKESVLRGDEQLTTLEDLLRSGGVNEHNYLRLLTEVNGSNYEKFLVF